MLVGVPGELVLYLELTTESFVLVVPMMATGWSAENKQALIEIWGDANVQSQPFLFCFPSTTGA